MKKGLQLLSRAKKEEGSAEFIVCVFVVFIILLCISFSFRIKLIVMTKEQLEDALTASALSAAIVDMDEYLRSGSMTIERNKAFEKFTENLKYNLKLNEEMKPESELYSEKITIDSFIVYNVKGKSIQKISYMPDGKNSVEQYDTETGTIMTENGNEINRSCIYVRVCTRLKGLSLEKDEQVSVDTLVSLEN